MLVFKCTIILEVVCRLENRYLLSQMFQVEQSLGNLLSMLESDILNVLRQYVTVQPLVYYNITRLSILNSLLFNTYTFPSFSTISPSIYYLSPLSTLIPTFFISSATLTTFLSFSLAIFIFFIYFWTFYYYIILCLLAKSEKGKLNY